MALEVGLLRRRHAVKAGARSGCLLPASSSQRRYNALPYAGTALFPTTPARLMGKGPLSPARSPTGPSPEGEVTLEGSGIAWSRKGTWLGTPRRVPDLSLPQGGTRRTCAFLQHLPCIPWGSAPAPRHCPSHTTTPGGSWGAGTGAVA